MCLAAWLGLQHLGYTEFSVAKRIVFGGVFRSVLSAQLALDSLEGELGASLTLSETWDVLCRTCPDFGFSGIAFDLDNVNRNWGIHSGWQARLDFPGRGQITFWRELDNMNRGASAVLFIDCVSRAFRQKLSSLETVDHD